MSDGALLAVDKHAKVVVLGDLNDYEFSDTVSTLTSGGVLKDLLTKLPKSERYTYVYEANSQLLDHVLVSPYLARKGSPEVDVVHSDAEFADADRASDHDAIVVRLRF